MSATIAPQIYSVIGATAGEFFPAVRVVTRSLTRKRIGCGDKSTHASEALTRSKPEGDGCGPRDLSKLIRRPESGGIFGRMRRVDKDHAKKYRQRSDE